MIKKIQLHQLIQVSKISKNKENMKQFITLKPMKSDGYKVLEKVNSQFYSLYEILDLHFYKKYFSNPDLINWLFNENRTLESNDWVYIQKENDKIALYDISASMDETYTGEYLVPEKRFEMSYKNFEEILTKWEEVRVSRPDTILIVIHEDNHVSLETDPVIIKQYQDAGYAFDIDKQ